MKSNEKSAGNNLCQKCSQRTAEAVCFNCNLILCFQCCIQHSQNNTTHLLKDLTQSMDMVAQKAKSLISRLEQKQYEDRQKLEKGTEGNSQNLHPQNFQKYLSEIEFIKKEVFKFVDRFFSELSLEFVNMWENYLLKFTTGGALIERTDQLMKWIKPYTVLEQSKSSGIEFVRMFLSENFEEKVDELVSKSIFKKLDKPVPQCPRIVINERILAEVEETLCRSIYTINYRTAGKNKIQDKNKVTNIRIETADTLDSSRKIVPIFPITGKFCFLYNLETNEYDIQEFDKLDILPASAKTIMLPNGDLHLIGGLDSQNKLLQQHLVYRHHKGEMAKLAPLPEPKNPSNGLAYHDWFIYVIGGLKTKGSWDSECFQYDVKRNEWKTIQKMNYIKPQQSVAVFNNTIIAFGLPFNQIALNIEQLDIETLEWKLITVANLLSNPFNFAAGFNAIQINDQQILLFGGKNYQDSLKSSKKMTDKGLCSNMYLFTPETGSFTQIPKANLTTGTQFGELNPIILNKSIYSFEFMISKMNPIVRWYDTVQVVKITESSTECLAIMDEG